MSDVLIQADSVSKKFCRSLKRSLWYGLQDMGTEALGRNGRHDTLRKDEFWAVKDVCFELRRGECLGLIGHNGAGKTTLLKMLNRLIKPDHGSITMRGRVGALIALGAGFNPILTGRENIYVNASVLGLTKREVDKKIDEIIDFADIGEFIDSSVQTYSSGMTVRLGFAIASAMDPQILLLDEVLAVGDVAFQAKSLNKLGEFRESGVGFILVSHNLHHISRQAQRTLYLSRGRVAFFGETAEAIDRFSDEMLQHQSSTLNTQPEASLRNPLGNGQVTFVDPYFGDPSGNRIDRLSTGCPLSLFLPYRAQAGVASPVLDILIRDKDGILFQGTNVEAGAPLGALETEGTIRVDFKSIQANNDVLSFFIALWSGDGLQLFDWRRDLRVAVKGRALSTGRTHMERLYTVTHHDKA